MASIRSPKSVFLSHGKVRQGLATLMEAPVNQLRFKVLCKFRERFEAAEFVRTCQKTGPCFILIQKPSSSKVLGGFTRTGWGTQYGTKHVDLEAFLFFCSSDFAPESVSKYLPMLRKLPHIPFPNVLWQQGGPAFNDDLVVREGGVSSRQQTYDITSEFIQEANTGGSPFKMEILAVWNSAWGAPEGIEHWRDRWENNLREDAWLPGISWDEKVLCLVCPHKSRSGLSSSQSLVVFWKTLQVCKIMPQHMCTEIKGVFSSLMIYKKFSLNYPVHTM